MKHFALNILDKGIFKFVRDANINPTPKQMPQKCGAIFVIVMNVFTVTNPV